MYPYNRRPYIVKEPEKNSTQLNGNSEIENSNLVKKEEIKQLSEDMNEIKNSLKKLEESIADIASKLVNIENRLDIDSKYRNVQFQYDNSNSSNQINSQINPNYETSSASQAEKSNEMPIMPGAGFSYITKEYLRNLNKNRQD